MEINGCNKCTFVENDQFVWVVPCLSVPIETLYIEKSRYDKIISRNMFHSRLVNEKQEIAIAVDFSGIWIALC
jgi:hypothetical protein